MSWIVAVNIKGVKDPIKHSHETEEAAEDDLKKISLVIGGGRKPDVPWLTVMGRDIISAHVEEHRAPRLA